MPRGCDKNRPKTVVPQRFSRVSRPLCTPPLDEPSSDHPAGWTNGLSRRPFPFASKRRLRPPGRTARRGVRQTAHQTPTASMLRQHPPRPLQDRGILRTTHKAYLAHGGGFSTDRAVVSRLSRADDPTAGAAIGSGHNCRAQRGCPRTRSDTRAAHRRRPTPVRVPLERRG